MEDNWWENSGEESRSTTPSRRDDPPPPFRYKAKGNHLMRAGGWVFGLLWLSLALAGTTSDFAEEIIFPEEHDVYDTKWPYAAVFSYIGLFNPNISLIPRGDKSKLSWIFFTTNLFFSKSLSKRST